MSAIGAGTRLCGAGTNSTASGAASPISHPGRCCCTSLPSRENIALGPCYYQGCRESEALAAFAELLEQLELQGHLTQYPPQVSPATYARAVWARELVKEPELILAVISGDLATTTGAAMLANVLQQYRLRYGTAALLLGESLEAFYPLGHRLFRLESGRLRKQATLEHRARPLTAYLPLV